MTRTRRERSTVLAVLTVAPCAPVMAHAGTAESGPASSPKDDEHPGPDGAASIPPTGPPATNGRFELLRRYLAAEEHAWSRVEGRLLGLRRDLVPAASATSTRSGRSR